jgi:nucleoside-triphosphatase THEP1
MIRPEKITIITGPVDSGKTTRLRTLVDDLHGEDKSVAGIITEAVYGDSGKKEYLACDLSSGKTKTLASIHEQENSFKLGKFYFSIDAFAFTHDVITKAIDTADVLVIDELGKLEVQKRGHYNDTVAVLDRFEGHFVLVIRNSLLEALLGMLHIKKKEGQISFLEIYRSAE